MKRDSEFIEKMKTEYERECNRQTHPYQQWWKERQETWAAKALSLQKNAATGKRNFKDCISSKDWIIFASQDGVLDDYFDLILGEYLFRYSAAEFFYGDEDDISKEYVKSSVDLKTAKDIDQVTDNAGIFNNDHLSSNLSDPWFKPDWSPDTLKSFFYFGNIFGIKRTRAEACKCFRELANKWNWNLGNNRIRFTEKQRIELQSAVRTMIFELRLSQKIEEQQDLSKQTEEQQDLTKQTEEQQDLTKQTEWQQDLSKQTEEQRDLPKKTIEQQDLSQQLPLEWKHTGDIILHIPEILFHSYASSEWENNVAHARYPLSTSVSIIIPSKDHPELLAACLSSIKNTLGSNQKGTISFGKWDDGYLESGDEIPFEIPAHAENDNSDAVSGTSKMKWEIIVVDNGSNDENRRRTEELQKEFGFRYLYEKMDFNFSKMCNEGARAATGEVLLFLNDDITVMGNEWLDILAEQAMQPHTGAVGAKLYYPDSHMIQHCGITNMTIGPVHKMGRMDELDYAESDDREQQGKIADSSRTSEQEKIADSSRTSEQEKIADSSRTSEQEKIADSSRTSEQGKIADSSRISEQGKIADKSRTSEQQDKIEAGSSSSEKEITELCDTPKLKNIYHMRNQADYNVIAVTGACLAIAREKYEKIGGFSEELAVAYNDVDLGFSLYEAGYYNIVRNDVVLYHHESISRGTDESPEKEKRRQSEWKKLYERHPSLFGTDPFYHKDLVQERLDADFHVEYPYPYENRHMFSTFQNVEDTKRRKQIQNLLMPGIRNLPGKVARRLRHSGPELQMNMDSVVWHEGLLEQQERMRDSVVWHEGLLEQQERMKDSVVWHEGLLEQQELMRDSAVWHEGLLEQQEQMKGSAKCQEGLLSQQEQIKITDPIIPAVNYVEIKGWAALTMEPMLGWKRSLILWKQDANILYEISLFDWYREDVAAVLPSQLYGKLAGFTARIPSSESVNLTNWDTFKLAVLFENENHKMKIIK